MNINVILLIVALVLFVVASIGVPSKINLLAAGLAFYILSLLVGSH